MDSVTLASLKGDCGGLNFVFAESVDYVVQKSLKIKISCYYFLQYLELKYPLLSCFMLPKNLFPELGVICVMSC